MGLGNVTHGKTMSSDSVGDLAGVWTGHLFVLHRSRSGHRRRALDPLCEKEVEGSPPLPQRCMLYSHLQGLGYL